MANLPQREQRAIRAMAVELFNTPGFGADVNLTINMIEAGMLAAYDLAKMPADAIRPAGGDVVPFKPPS